MWSAFKDLKLKVHFSLLFSNFRDESSPRLSLFRIPCSLICLRLTLPIPRYMCSWQPVGMSAFWIQNLCLLISMCFLSAERILQICAQRHENYSQRVLHHSITSSVSMLLCTAVVMQSLHV